MVAGRAWAALAFNWTESSLPYGIALCVVLLIGAGAIALVKRWRQKDAADSLSPSEQLATYRSLYDQGVMSKEEFDRLRTLLGGQIRSAVQAPAPPPRAPETGTPLQPPTGIQAEAPRANDGVQQPPAPESGNGQMGMSPPPNADPG
jgi:hypothetical protein